MEFYKTLKDIASVTKKIAAVTFVASLPYLCNDGCAYSGNKAHAAEIRQETRITENSQTPETETLEAVLEK